MTTIAGDLFEGTLDDSAERRVTAYVPRGPAEAVVFAADGGWHIEGLSKGLEEAAGPRVLIVGVHGREDDDDRLREYVVGVDAESFAAHEDLFVVQARRWAEARFGMSFPAKRTAVWGASLGGELALAMGLRHPDVFGRALVASPGARYEPPPQLPRSLPSFYFVAGTEEQFFLANARRWFDAVRQAGADAVLTQRRGEHGGEFWMTEFAKMVAWAFGSPAG